MLTLRRGLVPACLTLGVLLSALPPLAAPPAAAPPVSVSAPQMIRLQNVVPGDIVKMMHWELASNLPVGVTQIVSVPLQNALLVTGTPAGLAQVRKIVNLADIEPRPVQIKVATASVSEADLKSLEVNYHLVPLPASDLKQGFIQYASGYKAARFLQMLALQQSVSEGPILTASSDVEGSLALSTTGLPATFQRVRVTPHINFDSSVTLALYVAFSEGAGKREGTTLRTVKNGEILLLVMPPASVGDKNLLLFVTPTIK